MIIGKMNMDINPVGGHGFDGIPVLILFIETESAIGAERSDVIYFTRSS